MKRKRERNEEESSVWSHLLPPPRPGDRLHSSQREKEQSCRGGEHVVSPPGPMLRVTNCRNERNEMMESRWC